MKLLKLIANLGYGSRRDVSAMFADERICDAHGVPLHEKSSCAYADIRIDGEPLDPPPGVLLMLNKPCGYTCSTRDAGQIVYDLLPRRFRARSPIIAPVGRLDRQTSGLLLLTDDGALQHRITSPKSQLAKRYIAQLAAPLRGHEIAEFASGTLMLDGETTPLRPALLSPMSETSVAVELHEGRYHQVRRMFAAVGNHVEQLHRAAVGGLDLGDLPEGQWRVLDEQAVQRIFGR